MNLKQWDLWRLTFWFVKGLMEKNDVLIFFYRGKGRCLETLHWLYRVFVEFAHVKICQDISRNLKPQVPQVRCNVRQAGFKICGQKTSCPTSWFVLRKQQQGDFPLLSAKYCVARWNLGQRYDVKHVSSNIHSLVQWNWLSMLTFSQIIPNMFAEFATLCMKKEEHHIL